LVRGEVNLCAAGSLFGARTRVYLTLALLVGSVWGRSAQANDWIKLGEEEGVGVWGKTLQNSDRVTCKGRSLYPKSFEQMLAVVYDQNQSEPWLPYTSQYHILQIKSAYEFLIYMRFASPFMLVSDRDAVLDLRFNPQPDGDVQVVFKVHSHAPVAQQEGVVRMEIFEGEWWVQRQDKKNTVVTYELRAEAGGWVPQWMVDYVSRTLPVRVLKGLRAQMNRKDDFLTTPNFLGQIFKVPRLSSSSEPIPVEKNIEQKTLIKRLAEYYGVAELGMRELVVPKHLLTSQ
jgi:hypothetical protein